MKIVLITTSIIASLLVLGSLLSHQQIDSQTQKNKTVYADKKLEVEVNVSSFCRDSGRLVAKSLKPAVDKGL